MEDDAAVNSGPVTEGECLSEVARRAKGGDRAAFDALRAALEGPLRRFVRRLTGRTAEEEDILQDAFVALYMNIHRLEPVENLRPFLYRIVRNRCYDALRRQGRFRTVSLDAPAPDGERPLATLRDHGPGPDEAVQRMLLHAEVQRAIDLLPELQRQTLILFTYEEMTHAGIAEAMATDIGTVKSRLHHGRKNLLRRLRPDTLAALGVGKET